MLKKCICSKSLHSQLETRDERVNQSKNIYSTNRGCKGHIIANVCIETLPNIPIASEFAEICNTESI